MGFSVNRDNFIYNNNVNLNGATPGIVYDQCLFLNIVEDFIHNGFSIYDSEVVDQNGNSSRPPTTTDAISSTPITNLQYGTVSVILIPDATVDPLINSNPWFIKLTTLDGSNDTNFKSSVDINVVTQSDPISGTWQSNDTMKKTVSITSQTPVYGIFGTFEYYQYTGTYIQLTNHSNAETLSTASVVVPNTSTGSVEVFPYYYTGISIGVGYYSPSVEMPKCGSQTETVLPMYKILPSLTGLPQSYSPRLYPSNPYGYTLTIVERGFSLNIYPQSSTEDLQQSGYFVCQRAMSCGGSVTTTGNTPLYLVTNVSLISLNNTSDSTKGIDSIPGPQATWFSEIIREQVITTPYPAWSQAASNYYSTSYGSSGQDYILATTNISDTREPLGNVLHRFPDRWQAPVTRDTGEYILLFPFGICSNRYAYTDEIDLIAVSKANAYQATQSVPVTVYGQTRTYTAGTSNNKQVGNDNGIRVFIYTAGEEITATTSYNDINITATDTITTSWGNVQANTGS